MQISQIQSNEGIDINVVFLQQPKDFYRKLSSSELQQNLLHGWQLILKRSRIKFTADSGPLS